MNRKATILVVMLVVLVGGSLLYRDPVNSANAVRASWDFVVGFIVTLINALTTFFQQLFRSG